MKLRKESINCDVRIWEIVLAPVSAERFFHSISRVFIHDTTCFSTPPPQSSTCRVRMLSFFQVPINLLSNLKNEPVRSSGWL